MKIEWTPRTKSRPRFRLMPSGKIVGYQPRSNVDAEKQIAEQWLAQHGPIPHRGPVKVSIVVSKTECEVTIEPAHTETRLRGDIDNYAKLILDGLNGVAFIDDRQICELHIYKV